MHSTYVVSDCDMFGAFILGFTRSEVSEVFVVVLVDFLQLLLEKDMIFNCFNY